MLQVCCPINSNIWKKIEKKLFDVHFLNMLDQKFLVTLACFYSCMAKIFLTTLFIGIKKDFFEYLQMRDVWVSYVVCVTNLTVTYK